MRSPLVDHTSGPFLDLPSVNNTAERSPGRTRYNWKSRLPFSSWRKMTERPFSANQAEPGVVDETGAAVPTERG